MPTMTVGTFNVFAHSHTKYRVYGQAEPVLMDPSQRYMRLAELLNQLSAVDVWALQEVEPGLLSTIAHHPQMGLWRRLWTPNGQGKPGGCLTLLRPLLYEVGLETIEFTDESGHVAQILTLERPARGRFYLANTRLRWDQPDALPHAGVMQAHELLRQLHGACVLLCDSNDRPGGRVRRIIDSYDFRVVNGDEPTAWVDQAPAALDVIATRGITAHQRPTTHLAVDGIPNPQRPSDHIPIIARLEF
jgi:hypothetical protein